MDFRLPCYRVFGLSLSFSASSLELVRLRFRALPLLICLTLLILVGFMHHLLGFALELAIRQASATSFMCWSRSRLDGGT